MRIILKFELFDKFLVTAIIYKKPNQKSRKHQ